MEAACRAPVCARAMSAAPVDLPHPLPCNGRALRRKDNGRNSLTPDSPPRTLGGESPGNNVFSDRKRPFGGPTAHQKPSLSCTPPVHVLLQRRGWSILSRDHVRQLREEDEAAPQADTHGYEL